MSDTVHMPKEMVEAILAIMNDFGSLKKTEYNKHGKYPFAPVDDFYDRARKLFPENGLVILSSEEESALVPLLSKSWDADAKAVVEKTTVWVRTKWRFKLCHNGFTYDDGLFRFSQVPATGAQAEGIAQSYASKNFLRDLFKVATGEYELDDLPPEPYGAPVKENATEPVRAASPKTDAGESPSTVARDLFNRISSPDLSAHDVIGIRKEIDDNVNDKKIVVAQSTPLRKTLGFRERVFQAKVTANIEALRSDLANLPNDEGYIRKAIEGFVDSKGAILEAEASATALKA